jgi:hypothetical protein
MKKTRLWTESKNLAYTCTTIIVASEELRILMLAKK